MNQLYLPNEQTVQQPLTPEIIDSILSDKKARVTLTRESHYWFFHLYFSEYVRYPTATFQKEMFRLTEDPNERLSVIIAFRGSAKSTIMTMSYPLWVILGNQQKKCVVILSQTQQQAKSHLSNIKRELEGNLLLRSDLGPFHEDSDEWGSYSLFMPVFNAKIIAASSEQSIRGIRNGAYRPDLIICDDVEDLNSVKTRESRDKTYNWFTGEVTPLGDRTTKIIIVGNLLHEDSLLMRVKRNIENGRIIGTIKEYPLVNEKNEILWTGKYPTMQDIEDEKRMNGDDKAWQREYMLKIIPDEDQIVKPEWCQKYDQEPTDLRALRRVIICVDLAISKESSADYTAIIVAKIFDDGDRFKIYIQPHPTNMRLNFPETLVEIKKVYEDYTISGRKPLIIVEDVGYQEAVIQQLKLDGFNVEGFKTHGQDKRSRLDSVTNMIKSGVVLFPKNGCEELITQLTYFGVEKHDDLVDAFTMVLHSANSIVKPQIKIFSRAMLGL